MMRKLLVLGACLSLLSGCVGVSVNKGSAAPRPRALEGEAAGHVAGCQEIVRQDQFNRVGCTLTYENVSGRELEKVVIWCRAYDAAGYQVGVEKVELDARVVGPMVPGWKVRWPVAINAPPDRVARVECRLAWGL